MLAEFCIAALCSLVDCSQDADRLHGIAIDVASAVESAEVLPFDGDAAKEATALALIGTAFHESKFRADVQDCSLCSGKTAWCDHGRSVSIYQLMLWRKSDRAKVCASNAAATKAALATLVKHARYSGSSRSMFCGYASGDPGRCGKAANRLYKGFLKRVADNGITVDWRLNVKFTSSQ